LSPDQPSAQGKADPLISRSEMRMFAQRLLARREYGVRELHNRLLRKWPGGEQVEQRVSELIDELQAEGVLSDERFAESFIRSRLRRCQGPAKIQAELRRRSVPEAVIALQLERVEAGWAGLAADWLTRQVSPPLDYAAQAKYYRRLTNRGFSHQQALDALASLMDS